MAPDPPPTSLHLGTTLRRALAIEANGPDPEYREPGAGNSPPAVTDARAVREPQLRQRGTSTRYFPNEGGPVILEVIVPARIVALVDADPIAAGLARSGEIRFEPESGLKELRAEWHTLSKRVIPL